MAIAALASGDLSAFNGFSILGAIGSAWNTLAVTAAWLQRAAANSGQVIELEATVSVYSDADQEWATNFIEEAIKGSMSGSGEIPSIPEPQINAALHIIVQLASSNLHSYAEYRGFTYEEAVAELQRAYLTQLSQQEPQQEP